MIPSGLLHNRAFLALLVSAGAFIIYVGLPGRWDDVGLWDPEEIAVADEARALLPTTAGGTLPVTGASATAGVAPSAPMTAGAVTPGGASAAALSAGTRTAGAATATAAPEPRLGSTLIALGVRIFGVDARAGRPMIAFVAALTLACLFLAMMPFLGRRGALTAAAMAGGAPLFILHARQLLGDAPLTFAVGVAFLSLLFFLFLERPAHRAAAAFGFALALWLCWRARGATGLLLPFLAAFLSVGADLGGRRPATGATRPRLDPIGLAALGVLGAGLAATGWWVWRLIGLVLPATPAVTSAADRAAALAALGAAAGTVPADLSFDWVFEQIGLGFAPWSALLPLVAAVAFAGTRAAPGEAPAAEGTPPAAAPPAPGAAPDAGVAMEIHARLALHGLLWAVAGVLVLGTVGRFGRIPHAPVIVPLAVATAAAVENVVARRAVPGLFAFLALVLGVLLARDLAGHPDAMLRLLVPFGTPKLPEEFAGDFVPRIGLLAFGLAWALAAATLAIDPLMALGRRGRAALRTALRENKERPVAALSLPGPPALGRLAARVPTGPVVRLVRATGILGAHVAAIARRHAALLLPILGLGLGLYAAVVFLPAASAHLSQKGVFDTYHRLAAPGEELASFNVRGGGADYYLGGTVRSIPTQAELMKYLAEPARRFVLVGASSLATLHVAADKLGIRLYVLDDSNANQLLVSNKLLPGEEDKNVISRFVSKIAPAAGTYLPLGADLEGKLTVVGYSLDKAEASRGGSVTLKVYLEVKEKLGRDYKIFYHVEGPGERIKGDHVPVAGKYKTTFWQPGDYVVDEYTFKIGLGQGSGTYTIWGGFYYDGTNDDSRLKVRSAGMGSTDGANRLAIARIVVR